MGAELQPNVTISLSDFSYVSKTHRFWKEQAEWSEATFGSDTERGPLGPLKHLEKEAKEAQVEASMLEGFRIENNPDYDSDIKVCEQDLKVEIADCLFLTFDAARRAGMTLDDLLETAFRKLEINKLRKWKKPMADEAVEHVRE